MQQCRQRTRRYLPLPPTKVTFYPPPLKTSTPPPLGVFCASPPTSTDCLLSCSLSHTFCSPSLPPPPPPAMHRSIASSPPLCRSSSCHAPVPSLLLLPASIRWLMPLVCATFDAHSSACRVFPMSCTSFPCLTLIFLDPCNAPMPIRLCRNFPVCKSLDDFSPAYLPPCPQSLRAFSGFN